MTHWTQLVLGGIGVACALALGANAVLAAPLTFSQMCDASAGVALDETHFAVADDERDTLRVYDLATLEQTSELNLTNFLHNYNNRHEPKEGDLEGAVRRDHSVIWVASHGRNKDAEQKLYRWRFFETPVIAGSPPTLAKPEHDAYAGLHDDLLRFGLGHPELGLAQAEPNAPKKGGLNIEGLAEAGGDDLFVGLRSPLVAGKAVVLKMLDVSGVLSGNPGPVGLEKTALLDLGGRGIRSMEAVAGRILIVAGPSTEDDSAEGSKLGFRLFTWDGVSQVVELIDFDFGDLSPEALFEIGVPSQLLALSDDGTVKTNGVNCKDNDAAKSFRAIVVNLPQGNPS